MKIFTTWQNIITGDIADENVNVHDLISVGSDTVANMESQLILSDLHKRNTEAKIMASASAVKVAAD